MKITQKEELRILRQLLWKIGNSLIGAEVKNSPKIGEILSEIRYGYCYGQSNSYEGETRNDKENLRIRSLKRLDKI